MVNALFIPVFELLILLSTSKEDTLRSVISSCGGMYISQNGEKQECVLIRCYRLALTWRKGDPKVRGYFLFQWY